jgi:hypothetical protein
MPLQWQQRRQGFIVEAKIPLSSEEALYLHVTPSLYLLPENPIPEKNRPALFVLFSEEGQHENLPLVYDPSAEAPPCTLFHGKYSVRLK